MEHLCRRAHGMSWLHQRPQSHIKCIYTLRFATLGQLTQQKQYLILDYELLTVGLSCFDGFLVNVDEPCTAEQIGAVSVVQKVGFKATNAIIKQCQAPVTNLHSQGSTMLGIAKKPLQRKPFKKPTFLPPKLPTPQKVSTPASRAPSASQNFKTQPEMLSPETYKCTQARNYNNNGSDLEGTVAERKCMDGRYRAQRSPYDPITRGNSITKDRHPMAELPYQVRQNNTFESKCSSPAWSSRMDCQTTEKRRKLAYYDDVAAKKMHPETIADLDNRKVSIERAIRSGELDNQLTMWTCPSLTFKICIFIILMHSMLECLDAGI